MIDTHCHINFPDKFPDVAATVREAAEAGVDRLVVVGCDAETSRMAVELADRFEGVYAVVGWHPTYVADFDSSSLKAIEELLAHPKAVAIGEIGLDYHWDFTTREQQFRALFDQLDLAGSAGKPVVFHCREAYTDLLDLIEARPSHPYLFHCFSGDQAESERVVSVGGMIGVDGPITYKNARALREIVRSVPLDRLVIETDSPYLTPEPFRGKPNRPAYVTCVNAALAATIGIDAVECSKATTDNSVQFFGLPDVRI